MSSGPTTPIAGRTAGSRAPQGWGDPPQSTSELVPASASWTLGGIRIPSPVSGPKNHRHACQHHHRDRHEPRTWETREGRAHALGAPRHGQGCLPGGSHPLVLHCLPSPLQSSASTLHSGQCSPAPAPSAPGLLAPSPSESPLCSLRGGVLRASSVVSPSPGPPGNTARSMLLTPIPARSKPGQLSDYPASQGAGSPPLQGEPPPAPVTPCPEAELEMAGPLGLTALGASSPRDSPGEHLPMPGLCRGDTGTAKGPAGTGGSSGAQLVPQGDASTVAIGQGGLDNEPRSPPGGTRTEKVEAQPELPGEALTHRGPGTSPARALA